MKGRNWLFLALAIPLLGSRGSEAEEIRLSLQGLPGNMYQIEGGFEIPVPPEAAWKTLTDYDRIDEFVPSVRESRLMRREEGGALIEQKMAGGVLIFSRQVSLTLRVREDPLERVGFEDIARRDFASYRGEWLLQKSSGGTVVTYRLRAEPGFHVPRFLARGAFHKAVSALLQDVRREILRSAEREGSHEQGISPAGEAGDGDKEVRHERGRAE